MEWFENEEIVSIAETISKFSENEIIGKIVDLESLAKPEFPKSTIGQLFELGFLWGPAPEEIGGINMDRMTAIVVLSKLAEASAGFAAILANHYAAIETILSIPDGKNILKSIYERSTQANGKFFLFGLMLRDYNEIIDDFVDKNDFLYFNYICPLSSGNFDRALLFYKNKDRTELILVDSDLLKNCEKRKINLSGCEEMPSERILINEKDISQFKILSDKNAGLSAGRRMESILKLYYSAILQGNAGAATSYALNYTTERFQTGKMIIEHQEVRKTIVEMEIDNQAIASFLYRVAMNDIEDVSFNLCDMLFTFTCKHTERICLDAIQLLGGYGYMKEYGLEKKFRDNKTIEALVNTYQTDWLG
jgi:alkylation response protein AidB-like acyl-CoA dehydrogenase